MAGERDRVEVDEAALSGYRSAVGDLAEEVRSVATATLAGTTGLPADCFGKIGAEVGLSTAFHDAAQAQLDGVTVTANGMAALAGAVGEAVTGYQEADADAGATLSRAGQRA